MGDANDTNDAAEYALASFQEREGEYVAAFERFLSQCYRLPMRRLYSSLTTRGGSNSSSSSISAERTAAATDESLSLSLRICAQLLIDASPRLAALLFRFPDEFLPLLHRALAQQLTAMSQSESLAVATLPVKLRQQLKVRVEFLPPVALLRKPTINTIRSSDVKRLIQVAGTVVRTGMVKMQERSREVVCASAKCQYRFLVTSDLEQGNILELPKVCPSDSEGKPCKSTQFTPVDNVVADHQVIKIQEQVSKLGVGSIPRSILVVLEEDLVDSVKAGDHVVVVGVLMRSWKPCIPNVRCDLETMVRANSIRVQNASSAQVLVTEELKKEFHSFWHETFRHNPMRGRNAIVASVCPKVYGLFVVKLALLLTIIGGCGHVDATGMKTRGEPHLLLIGDPGTGKSQFLRFAAELSPRSVLTTGIGTTSAGLTCTAVKDGSEWMLEAGALVLADRGVCCIDEFSSMRAHDRASIHEAMEQQTLSVAKAGLVCKLNARATVFAVTNPKGQYDPNADVAVNTSIASPLLSRFDLILVLLDRRNAHWDQVVSSFILQQSTEASSSSSSAAATSAPDPDPEESNSGSKTWSIAKLQAYICHVKDTLQPRLSRGAMSVLQRYYQVQRSAESRSAARTTIRLLESLTRLAQAHARLMFHDEVAVVDAVVAVFLMEVSKAVDSGSTMLGGGVDTALHTDFAEDPDAEYALQERLVLEYLGLTELRTTRGGGGGGGAPRQEEEEDGEEEKEVYVPSSMEDTTVGRKRPRPSSKFQWQHVATTKTSKWGAPPPLLEDEYVEEEVVEDEYYRQVMRESQADTEPKDPKPQSQALWKSAMGSARVQRWSQSGSQRDSGGRGGGNGGEDADDPPPPVTSKWWRR